MNAFYKSQFIFETREAAEKVLEEMKLELDAWGCVDVEFLYEVSGIKLPPYVTISDQYGWKNLDEAKIVDIIYGFKLKLPEPEFLD